MLKKPTVNSLSGLEQTYCKYNELIKINHAKQEEETIKLVQSRINLYRAAPELLEALEGMVRMYEKVQPAGGWQGQYEESISAIQKAKGE